MQLTKYTHACVRLDDGDRSLVIDPGVFSEFDPALDGAQAVLVTHEHPDHVDLDKLRAAAGRDSRLRIYAPDSVLAALGVDEQAEAVVPESSFEAAGFTVRTFGGWHAPLYPTIPVVTNIGYLVDGNVYHPGDSFAVPTAPVGTLLAPLHAPWSKMSEVVDFAISVRAPRTLNVHDSLLTDVGRNMVEGVLGRNAGPHGTEFTHLAPGETLSV